VTRVAPPGQLQEVERQRQRFGLSVTGPRSAADAEAELRPRGRDVRCERLAADLGTSVERIDGGKHFTPEDHPEVIARGINELVVVG